MDFEIPMELALNKWRRENHRRRRAHLPELELPTELQAYVDRRDTAVVVQQRFDLSRDEWWGRAAVLERVGRTLPCGHEVLQRPLSVLQLHLQRTEWSTLEAALRKRHPEFIPAERKVRPNTKLARLTRETANERQEVRGDDARSGDTGAEADERDSERGGGGV